MRKLSPGTPAHSVTCLSQDLSQACQTPSSTPSSTPYKPEHPLPFLTGFGLTRKIFSPTWLKREITSREGFSEPALRVQCKERVPWPEVVRRLSASSISYSTSSLALRSTARGVQSRMLQASEPNTARALLREQCIFQPMSPEEVTIPEGSHRESGVAG